MGSVPPKQDIVFPAIMILAISLALVNVALSYYATENFVMLIFDYPISVAYQAAYPGVVSLLVAPAYLFMKRPGPRRVVVAGTVLGLVGGVFAHEGLASSSPCCGLARSRSPSWRCS